MANKFELKAEYRKELGRGANRRMQRLLDKVPAILYGIGTDPQPISMQHKEVIQALGTDAIFSNILTLDLGDKKEKVILKDLLRHPVKARILHMDFLRVSENRKLSIHVPLHFSGDTAAPGFKAGGIFSKHMNEVEIRCLPANLPESINIDLSSLELNAVIHLSDLRLPPGVELAVTKLDEAHDRPVVSIHMPRAEKEEVEVAAPVAEGAVPATEAKPEAEAKPSGKEAKPSGKEAKPSGKEAKETKPSKG